MIARFARFWLPVIVWCAIIFVQSSFATPRLVPDWSNIDKILHAGVYGLLGFLLCRALSDLPGWSVRPRRLIVAATLLATLYGFSDEWHQSFVSARTADAADLLADFIGGLAGAGVYIWFQRVFQPPAKMVQSGKWKVESGK